MECIAGPGGSEIGCRHACPQDHDYRLTRCPARTFQSLRRAFKTQEQLAFTTWHQHQRDRRFVKDALASQWVKESALDPAVQVSLRALRTAAEARIPVIRETSFAGPPVFPVKPGLNILGPPYDLGLNVGLGSNRPSVQVSVATGRFGVVATAVAGKETFGSAGVVLFIVPSAPHRTLSIRPYFEWSYIFTCESFGPPTAHSYGLVAAEVTGHRSGGPTGYPGKRLDLWSTGSDLWDDTHGEDSNVFRNPDSELVVSGHDYYTVSFVCQTGADSGKASFGWYSASYVQFHCRVPFLVVEEF